MRRLQFFAARNLVSSSPIRLASPPSLASLLPQRHPSSYFIKNPKFLYRRAAFSTCTRKMSSERNPPQLAYEAQDQSPRFTQLVVDAMRKLYPEELADRAWDNVGLLLDSCPTNEQHPTVMVTNDLTYRVAMDAIDRNVSVIVSYHPFIFSGLKSITNKDPQQATLLQLVRAGIAVYCPHTAVDAAPEGLNSWLADVVSGTHNTERSFANPCRTAPESHSPAGYGIVADFANPVPLKEILRRIAAELGGMKHLMVALPVGKSVRDTTVRNFGVCAGSGADVLKNADVDLLFTGEMSHHPALKAVQQGRTVVQVFHSNSERTYLQKVLAPKLQDLLKESEPRTRVITSSSDRDPFSIIDVSEIE